MSENKCVTNKLVRENEPLLRRITERKRTEKRTEEAIKGSEGMFKRLFEESHASIALVDTKGILREANQSLLTLLAISKEELIGKDFGMLASEFGLNIQQQLIDFRERLAGGTAANELTFLNCEGKQKTVIVQSSNFRSGDQVTGVLYILQDITLRKQTLEALRQSEERFRILFEQAADIILQLEITPEGMPVIREANSATFRLLGYEREELIGKPVSFIDAAPDASTVVRKRRQNVLSGTGTVFEAQHRCKDGTIRDFECTGTEMHIGSKTFAISVERDITGRKRAEKGLQESEARYRALFEASAEGILIADLETKIFKYANPAICRMLGYAENELTNMSLADIHPKEALQNVIAEFEAQARGEKALAEGLPCLRKDGVVFYADINAVKIIIDGKPCNAGFFRDITERRRAEEEHKKLEERLRQSQKLEAIGQLSSGVAHDFNNLLGVIMGYAELMKMNRGTASDLEHHVYKIILACTKAADLTRKLLSFARKAPVEFKKVDLNSIIKNVVEILKRTIDHRVEIILDVQEQSAIIFGDWNQLENAFLNIAINARDAMAEGGRLSITLKTVDVNQAALPNERSEITEGPYVRISIADTGTGMSKESIDHIFEPFFTTKEVGKGTGLGLASVYGCVKQHLGYITMESQKGRGTEFTIYLPVITSTVAIESIKEEATLHPGTGTLLVVDDETVYHEILAEIFGGLGYTVHCCADGAEAVAFYREHKSTIDVVILDINMPRMNGLQCLMLLKEINPKVKAIVTSGYGDNSDREAMQKEGVCAFVQKPYRAAELAKKIAEITG